ncbi:MAG TPA: hypothetical protein VGW38_24245, partial [Chloroflexota bacterium]|nr:hypothetical protein [Chloroflexota bacterium]
PLALWEELNDRQRAYLREAFALDQETEAAIAQRRARGFYNDEPASVWRWLRYGYVHSVDDPPGLALRLKRQGFTDEGTGSTWQALARRGLIRVRYVGHPLLPRENLLEVQLTPLGRRVMRTVEPTAAKAKRPAGALTEWQWRGLARVVAAMPEGIPYDIGYPGIGETTLRRLEEGRDGALVVQVDPETGKRPRWGWRDMGAVLRLTERGRTYYEQHYATYRERYPAVDAPTPGSAPSTPAATDTPAQTVKPETARPDKPTSSCQQERCDNAPTECLPREAREEVTHHEQRTPGDRHQPHARAAPDRGGSAPHSPTPHPAS